MNVPQPNRTAVALAVFGLCALFLVVSLLSNSHPGALIPTSTPGPDANTLQAAYLRGFDFLEKLDIRADTLTEQELAGSPPEARYENVSELELYRQLDFLIDIRYIREAFGDVPQLRGKIALQKERFASVIPKWQAGTIDYNYFDSQGPRGTYAFDLYCILAQQEKNRPMEQKVFSELKGRGNWHTPSAQAFRVITDESWCLSLLADFREDAGLLGQQARLKREQVDAFLQRTGTTTFEDGSVEQFVFRAQKMFAVTHELMLLHQLRKNGYAVDTDRLRLLQELLEKNVLEHSKKENDYLVTGLYWLSISDYPSGEALQTMAKLLLEKQEPDGGWKPAFDSQHARGLMTARALLALKAYENYRAEKK